MNPRLHRISTVVFAATTAAISATRAHAATDDDVSLALIDPEPASAASQAHDQPDPQTTPSADLSLPSAAETPPPQSIKLPPKFGEEKYWWWGFDTGLVSSDDATDFDVSINFDYFLREGFEFRCGLRGWYFNQDGDDAGGINPHLGFRWHFILDQDSQAYSVYADFGIGLLATTDDVPAPGTSFNFTPRLGVGATFALGDSGARFDIGVGWHHISNASSFGTDDNPARDGIALYLGVMLPL
ncbi:MAG TPA: acyloxyacyl hydrolase [Phycisphaerales bacterium]|nr:acyloxyacyl hydrolase [Phycisphaerales bacterium]